MFVKILGQNKIFKRGGHSESIVQKTGQTCKYLDTCTHCAYIECTP
jgi:hypothetical protein